jgi:SNF2 family DNA or RNA helicase
MIFEEEEFEIYENNQCGDLYYEDINSLNIYKNNGHSHLIKSGEDQLCDILKYSSYIDQKSEQEDRLQEQNKFGIKLNRGLNLMPHQIEVIDWMKEIELRSNPFGVNGGVVSLEMGLGKSIISLSYILSKNINSIFIDKQNFPTRPSLIICPKNIIFTTWKSQIEKFFGPNQHKYLLIEKEDDVSCLFNYNDLLDYKIVIITYSRLIAFAKSAGAIKIISSTKKVSNNQFNNFGDLIISNLCIYNQTNQNKTLFKNKKFSSQRSQIQYIINEDFLKSKSDHEIKNLIGLKFLLFHFKWENIICDESHNFRNIKSLLFKTLQLVKGKFKWCFTGTPIVNYYNDLISQFVFLGLSPDYTDKKKFQNTYVCLRNYIYHKTYKDCNIVLPPIEYKKEYVKLSQEEREFYNLYFKHASDNYQTLIKNEQREQIFTIIMRLRQICISSHLILIKEKEKNLNALNSEFEINFINEYLNSEGSNSFININPSNFINKIDEKIKSNVSNDPKMSDWLYDIESSAGINSAKIKQVIEIVKNKIPKNEKILIFSMFKSVTELFFHAFKINCPENELLLFNGDQSLEERNSTINLFKEDPLYRVLFITYQTGSEGLNIFQANNVILLEGWWNFAVENQAIARCHRIGQQNKVCVWKLIVEESIEQRMEMICYKKKEDYDFFVTNNIRKNDFSRDMYLRALLADEDELENLLKEI